MTDFFVEGDELGQAKFLMYVSLKKDLPGDLITLVISTEITRYFNPEDYIKQGHQNPISISRDTTFLHNGFKVNLSKSISENTVNFYPFPWIDTSGFTLFDLGESFKNY